MFVTASKPLLRNGEDVREINEDASFCREKAGWDANNGADHSFTNYE